MSDTRKVLTPKMIMACEYYLRGKSMKEAMLAAGYNRTYCDGNVHIVAFLKKRQVMEYIRKRQESIAAAASLDQAECVKYARKILESDDPKDRSKALELLMRMGIPIAAPENLKADDIKNITINIEQAKKDE